jgi:hypothetical protein
VLPVGLPGLLSSSTWRLADPHIRRVMEHCEVEALDVYGQPGDEVVRRLPQPGGDTPVTITPHLTGFMRRDH